MSGYAPVLLLAAASWVVRLSFIVLIPARLLRGRVSAALSHVTPAVLAALISVETLGVVREGSAVTGCGVLACLTVIGVAARRRPSPAITAGLGIAAVALIDVVLAR
jgi:branched-subunit amino acid transport protein